MHRATTVLSIKVKILWFRTAVALQQNRDYYRGLVEANQAAHRIAVSARDTTSGNCALLRSCLLVPRDLYTSYIWAWLLANAELQLPLYSVTVAPFQLRISV